MFFALGFLAAGLLGLMILPALWRRAVRLSTRRIEMQTPLSMDEVLADRDLLRAEFAVVERRLEERLAQAQDAHARDRAELGRKIAALVKQGEALEALRDEQARTQGAFADAEKTATELQAELGAALLEAHDGLTAREHIESLKQELFRAQRFADDRRLAAAAAETRLAGAEAQLQDARAALAESQTSLERVQAERDRVRAELAYAGQMQASLRGQIEEREQRIDDLENSISALNHKRESKQDDASLRASIADLGAEVLRIAQALEERPARPQPERNSARTSAGAPAE